MLPQLEIKADITGFENIRQKQNINCVSPWLRHIFTDLFTDRTTIFFWAEKNLIMLFFKSDDVELYNATDYYCLTTDMINIYTIMILTSSGRKS